MAKRSTKALIGVGLLVALLVVGLVVGFVALVVMGISSYFRPTEYDFVESASSSGQCFRLDDITAVVQLQVASADEHPLEVDHAKLIDARDLTITALGLVDGPDAPFASDAAPTREAVEALTVPNERFLDLTAASPQPAFLLFVVQSESGEGTASGVTLEYSPGEPLWVDNIGFDLDVSSTDCVITDVTG